MGRGGGRGGRGRKRGRERERERRTVGEGEQRDTCKINVSKEADEYAPTQIPDKSIPVRPPSQNHTGSWIQETEKEELGVPISMTRDKNKKYMYIRTYTSATKGCMVTDGIGGRVNETTNRIHLIIGR